MPLLTSWACWLAKPFNLEAVAVPARASRRRVPVGLVARCQKIASGLVLFWCCYGITFYL